MKPQFESISPLETNSFKAFHQIRKEFDYPYHYHPEYELTYILSSDGVRYVGNEFHNFSADDLVLLGPNLPHCWKNSEQQATTASAVVIQWKEDLLGKDWMETKEFASIKKMHNLSAKGIKFPEKIAKSIKNEMMQIVTLDPFSRLLKLISILEKLSRAKDFNILCKDDFTHHTDSSDHERINQIYHFVKTNYSKKITLAGVASIVCMTEESFSRFFSKVMKKKFFSFLNEYRVNVACRLLIESDIPITQVCYNSGYETIPFFYRQFKKFKKCSPQFYRSQFKITGNYDIPVSNPSENNT